MAIKILKPSIVFIINVCLIFFGAILIAKGIHYYKPIYTIKNWIDNCYEKAYIEWENQCSTILTGMSIDEVKKILGQPTSTVVLDEHDNLIMVTYNAPRFVRCRNDKTYSNFISIVFKDDCVVSGGFGYRL